VLALCEGSSARIAEAERNCDTMAGVGRILNWFRRLKLRGCQEDQVATSSWTGWMRRVSVWKRINNGASLGENVGSAWNRMRTRCSPLDRYAFPIVPWHASTAPACTVPADVIVNGGVALLSRGGGEVRPTGRAVPFALSSNARKENAELIRGALQEHAGDAEICATRGARNH
jgi:hypothetical protein